MSCYIVTFETRSEPSHQRVVDQLKVLGAYCPVHHYCWAVLTDKTAKELCDSVALVMEKGERIFVVRSGTEAAWRNAYGEKNNEWLKTNL
jgi:hypothetical protein